MATYNPPADLLERQLDSIRAQTHTNWICVISDDCSSPERYAAIEAAIAGEPRFVLSRSPRRLGFYRNFERALALVPEHAEYVAMADQDDDWRPDKLAVLLARIGGAQLVYSDARVVGRDGEVISETWWNRRRNNHSDLLSLLVANAVTGAASLMRRELLDYALPFPPAQFAHFHDHWIGLTALSLGEIEFVAEPLYDYVQHGDASLGHAAANRMTSLRDRIAHRRALRERVRMWRLHYFVDIWRLRQFAAVLLMRCSERMSSRKRRTLERFIGADDSLASLLGLAVRGARELTGTPETLGAEWALFHALAWRRLLGISARPRPQRRLRLDALPPSSLVQHPGRVGLDADAAAIAEKIAPLRWNPADDAPGAREPADPDDRPAALLRGLHRQVQPRAAPGAAGPQGPHRHGRPGGHAAGGLAAHARIVRRPERAARRGRGRVRPRVRGGSSAAGATASSPPPGGPRTWPARRWSRWAASVFCT